MPCQDLMFVFGLSSWANQLAVWAEECSPGLGFWPVKFFFFLIILLIKSCNISIYLKHKLLKIIR